MDVKIAVASHKPYRMPGDPVYIPLHVGSAGKPSIDGFRRDDAGDGISGRNPNWCELTGLYWMWKNVSADALGLVHYRRHFKGASGIASGAEIAAILESGADAILPRRRNYFIESTYSQYVHAHHAADLDTTRDVIAEIRPGYLPSFDGAMKSTKGHRFNMFVMRRRFFESYCEWLFGILFELEKRLDISNYSPYDARVFGFVSERLLDVWLARAGARVAELPVLHLEPQHWPSKIARFILRKINAF